MIRLNRLPQIVVGSLVVSAVFACGDVATAPEGPAFALAPVKPPAFTTCPSHPGEKTSALIGVQGGTLEVGGQVLIVPPGALKTTTLITMETPAGTLRRVEFGPEGLTFLRPAHLIMSYRGCTLAQGARQEVVYVNESLSILETTPSESDPNSSTIKSRLSHFSGYVLVSTYAVVY